VLGGLPRFDDPNVLAGSDLAEDAGVYRVSGDLALVQTLDFFTPVVDDPFDFGRVAAANALSDVYAMGAAPFMALNIVGFPAATLDLQILHRILRGAAEVCLGAEVAVVGGHSIDDPEPKFGLAVTGRVHPDRLWLNSSARAGDLLVLTKPLGIGILTTGIKQGRLNEAEVRRAVDQMAALNRPAAEAGREAGITAATDVTGYGLLGHLHEMAAGSGLSGEVWMEEVPVLLEPRVRELIPAGAVPGGSRKNLAYAEPHLEAAGSLTEADRLILADAQTSGGLLLAVSPERCDQLTAGLRARGTAAAAVVGRLEPGPPGRLRLSERRPA
jgi:selenide,water dikinase